MRISIRGLITDESLLCLWDLRRWESWASVPGIRARPPRIAQRVFVAHHGVGAIPDVGTRDNRSMRE